MSHSDLGLLVRILVGFALAYIFGFERQLRGSSAGDRTFSMIGAAAAAITAVAGKSSPQAVAGVVTGVGFIGGGVVFRGQLGMVRGVTTAATIFAAVGIGIVVGFGHLALGAITTALLLLTLELQHIPFLRWLDASSYSERFTKDKVEVGGDEEAPPMWPMGMWPPAKKPAPGSPPAGSAEAKDSGGGPGPLA